MNQRGLNKREPERHSRGKDQPSSHISCGWWTSPCPSRLQLNVGLDWMSATAHQHCSQHSDTQCHALGVSHEQTKAQSLQSRGEASWK